MASPSIRRKACATSPRKEIASKGGRAAQKRGRAHQFDSEDAREAGFKSLPNIVNYPGKDGQQLRKPFHPVLAMGRVRYVGEPVAMIVAETAAIAEDARERAFQQAMLFLRIRSPF